jgi:hypothetical protein
MTSKLGESPRVQSRDVSLVASVKEWTGEFKDGPVHKFFNIPAFTIGRHTI